MHTELEVIPTSVSGIPTEVIKQASFSKHQLLVTAQMWESQSSRIQGIGVLSHYMQALFDINANERKLAEAKVAIESMVLTCVGALFSILVFALIWRSLNQTIVLTPNTTLLLFLTLIAGPAIIWPLIYRKAKKRVKAAHKYFEDIGGYETTTDILRAVMILGNHGRLNGAEFKDFYIFVSNTPIQILSKWAWEILVRKAAAYLHYKRTLSIVTDELDREAMDMRTEYGNTHALFVRLRLYTTNTWNDVFEEAQKKLEQDEILNKQSETPQEEVTTV